MLILDSNIISYYLRGEPQVVPRLQALRPVDLGVPAIVEYELRYGLLRMAPEAAAPRLAALAQLLQPLQILPFDSECAAHAARIRVALEAAGTPIASARYAHCSHRPALSSYADHAQRARIFPRTGPAVAELASGLRRTATSRCRSRAHRRHAGCATRDAGLWPCRQWLDAMVTGIHVSLSEMLGDVPPPVARPNANFVLT